MQVPKPTACPDIQDLGVHGDDTMCETLLLKLCWTKATDVSEVDGVCAQPSADNSEITGGKD